MLTLLPLVAYDDEIGTSFDQIVSVINGLENDALCFYDIGSAGMNLDTALEMYEGDHKIVKMEAPIVEGSFIASVGIKSNMSMDSVISEVELNILKNNTKYMYHL